MKIIIIRDTWDGGEPVFKGTRGTPDAATARQLVALGHAVEATPENEKKYPKRAEEPQTDTDKKGK